MGSTAVRAFSMSVRQPPTDIGMRMQGANDMDAAALAERVAHLEDRESIRSVLYRYCTAADRCDAPLMRSCYHPDAIDDHGFFAGDAWAFCDYVTQELSRIELSVHTLANISIELTGDMATAVSYYSVIHRIRTWFGFTDFQHQGRYFDRLERRQGEWRISRRMICQDGERWFHTADLSFLVRKSPNVPPQGRQNRDDPFYLGPDFPSLMRPRPRLKDIWTGFRRTAWVPLWLLRLLSVLGRRLLGATGKSGGA